VAAGDHRNGQAGLAIGDLLADSGTKGRSIFVY